MLTVPVQLTKAVTKTVIPPILKNDSGKDSDYDSIDDSDKDSDNDNDSDKDSYSDIASDNILNFFQLQHLAILQGSQWNRLFQHWWVPCQFSNLIEK